MTSIDVRCGPSAEGWTCLVRLSDGPSTTEHRVTVSSLDLARLSPGSAEPDELVRRSFEFLLARESKESILRSFDITVIGRYFPEYEVHIRPRP